MGAEGIQVSVMIIGMKVCIVETLWMGGDVIRVSMIFFNVKEQQITSIGTLTTSFCSSGSQKKEYSDSGFGCRDVGDAVIFEGEVTSFVSLALGFQKRTDRRQTSYMETPARWRLS